MTSRQDRSFEFRNGDQEKGTRSLPATGTQEGKLLLLLSYCAGRRLGPGAGRDFFFFLVILGVSLI